MRFARSGNMAESDSFLTGEEAVRRIALVVVALLTIVACKPKPPVDPPPTTTTSTTATTEPPTTTTATTEPPTTTSTTSTTTTSTTTSTTTPPMSGQDACTFSTFCDNFAAAMPGGRGGDLDESKWSFSRLSQETNPSQGSVDKFVPVDAEHCMEHETRLADADSFICGQEFGESNHWMEAFYDNGSYVNVAARILQPFDFAGRTGTLDFSVDGKSTGGHGVWWEVWLTDQPVNSPHRDAPGTHAYPRNGVSFIFESNKCGRLTGNTLTEVNVFHDYQQTVIPAPQSCFSTEGDMANRFQIKVATDHVEVWASEKDGTNFRQRASIPVSLNFTRGSWDLEHSQYNGSKECAGCPNEATYHWHAVSFDGPVVPTPRSYQVPDALRSTCGGNNNLCGVNLGYTPGCWGQAVACSDWMLNGVDLTGATSAYLTFDTWYAGNPKTSRVTVNGHVHDAPDANPDANNPGGDAWRYVVLPIPLSELAAGANTVKVAAPSGCAGNCMSVANVDLEVIR